ncbi:MAG TPA: hypothetical protein VE988_11170, partial [Gemmataceae bacterium]|nr:hypothetical protein [Gemmataceae bacterium]
RGVQQWDAVTVKKGMTFARFDKEAGPRRPRGSDILFTFAGTAGYSMDGKLLAVSMGESGVGVWDVASGKTKKLYGPDAADKEKEIGFGGESLPYAFAFAPHGNILAVSTSGGAIKLWDAATGKALRSWVWHQGAAKPQSPDGLPNQVGMLSLAFSPDGKTLAGGGVHNMFDGLPQSTIILWEAATGKERLRVRTPIKSSSNDDFGFELELLFSVFDNMPMALTFSPDGKQLMVGTFTGLHVIDALTGKDVISFSGRQMVGRTATFSQDGKLLFVGKADGTVRIIDAANGRLVRDLPAHTEAVLTLALSANGKTLASGSSDSTVLLWDVAEITKPVAGDKVTVTAKEMETLWTDLASTDAAKAYQSINALASAPAVSVPFLKTKLKPIAPADPKVLQQLLEDLNSEKYPTREKATVELEKLGDLARAALYERLKANPPLEMKQRMEKLMSKLNGPVESAQTLQALRAIETLERIGTPEAMGVLTALANGAAGHRITEDAKESVQRLEKQMKKR